MSIDPPLDPIVNRAGNKPPRKSAKLLDAHVHIVGNGGGGTGCWMRTGLLRRPMQSLMCKHIGLPLSALKGDFDRLYVERLLELVRTSSLDGAVILAHEQVYDEHGKLMEGAGSFHVPNSYVLELAGRYPDFLPAVSIHPARADALEELERCLSAGAVMLKLLPNCHNVDANDRRYTRFWERMAEAGLPLLAHTGGEHSVQVMNASYADPRVLELPLQCGVKVIAAHCATKSGLFDPDYLPVLIEMMNRHPNLYADNSAFNIPIRSRAIPTCLKSPVVDRLVHGSDFPVPIYGHWAWMRGLIDYSTLKRLQHEPNVLERDYQLKLAMGFPWPVFTRVCELLRSLPQVVP
ncbi:MAG: Amidohydrolase 2 [Chthoniobacteraceae bacterium]|nr:Amidohydrolase 2 [Chthoniobacteraceae bacterium]